MILPGIHTLKQTIQAHSQSLSPLQSKVVTLIIALVIGTPPTMMAYSTGFFKTSDIFKRGIVLDLIGVLILSFGVIWIWQLLGVVMIR
jgi:sodium-dependent dicarboxylate transporter 2/3/5